MRLNSTERKIFFISDTHAYHTNIVRGISEWGDRGTRDFKTQEDHLEALIKNINDNVGHNDILFHLGDWSFGGIDKIWKFRQRINCREIHLILGNHDHHIQKNKVLPNVYKGFSDGKIYDGYFDQDQARYAKAKELFTSVDKYLEISIDGQMICMSHYPARMWNNAAKGSWFLYGHCHGNLPEYEFAPGKLAKTMDVGVDTNDLKPYSFEELKKIMDKRHPIVGIDHHRKNTTNHSNI